MQVITSPIVKANDPIGKLTMHTQENSEKIRKVKLRLIGLVETIFNCIFVLSRVCIHKKICQHLYMMKYHNLLQKLELFSSVRVAML